MSSTEFGREIEHYQDLSLTQRAVVTYSKRERIVMISVEEYQRLMRRDRQVFAAGELLDELVEPVARSEMDPRHGHLDELVKD